MSEFKIRRGAHHCAVCGVKKETPSGDRLGLCDACFPFALFWQGFVFGHILCRLVGQSRSDSISGRHCVGDPIPAKHAADSFENNMSTPFQCETANPHRHDYDTPTLLQCDTPTPAQYDTPTPLQLNTPTLPRDTPTRPAQNQFPKPDQFQTDTFPRHLAADFPEKVFALKLDSNDSPAAVSADKYLDNPVQHGAELTNSNNCSALHMQVMPFTSHDDSDDHNDEVWTPPTNAMHILVRHRDHTNLLQV